MEHIRRAKESLDIPVIGSLNGVSTGGWIEYARLMEEAGADALELNIYYIATDMDMPGEAVEQLYLDVLRDVQTAVSIPIAMKLSPTLATWPTWPTGWLKPGPMGWFCSTAFTSQTWTWKSWPWCPT
jgi:dihydroorotate dehydrogenase (fumarate)